MSTDTPRRRTHTTTLADLADAIRDLTEPGRHAEPYRIQSVTSKHKRNYLARIHTTNHASLLDQLRECTYNRAQNETEAANRPAQTVPHIDVDAIDRLTTIENAAGKWRQQLDIPSRAHEYAAAISDHSRNLSILFPSRQHAPTELWRAIGWLRIAAERTAGRFDHDLPALVGAAATRPWQPCDCQRPDSRRAPCHNPTHLERLVRDAARWVTWCRVFAGWETPPWRPRARCPHCDAAQAGDDGQPAGLRVRLDIRSAVCLSCDATWSDADGEVPIEVLAEHIRQTTDTAGLSPEQVAALLDPGKRSPYNNRGGPQLGQRRPA